MFAHEGNDDNQDRADAEGQQRQQPVHADHDEEHHAKEGDRRQNGENPIHGDGLNGVGIRRDAIKQITHLSSAVEGQREALEMTVEITPEIVHHPLTDLDRGVVVENRQPPQEQVNQHQAEAGKQEEHFFGIRRGKVPGDGFAAQHIVDDNFQGPRLQDFTGTDHENLKQRNRERNPVGPQIPQNFSSHGNLAFVEVPVPAGLRLNDVTDCFGRPTDQPPTTGSTLAK